MDKNVKEEFDLTGDVKNERNAHAMSCVSACWIEKCK